MRYRALADAVVVVHFGFVLFVVAGVLAVVWKPWLGALVLVGNVAGYGYLVIRLRGG